MQREPYITTREAAEFLGLSVATLNKWRVIGLGPAYFKLGKAVRYRLSELEEWASSQRKLNTSQV